MPTELDKTMKEIETVLERFFASLSTILAWKFWPPHIKQGLMDSIKQPIQRYGEQCALKYIAEEVFKIPKKET